MKRNLFWCLVVIAAFMSVDAAAQTVDFTSVINFGAIGVVKDIAIQPDNKIIMFAPCTHINLSGVPFCGVRLNVDGSLDTAFKSNTPNTSVGVFTFVGSGGAVSDVKVQSDGKIIAAGYGTGATLVRYNSDGTLDSSFGTAGVVITNVSGQTRGKKIAIQPDGKIVLVGDAAGEQLVARYLPDGSLDSSFGKGGFVLTSLPGSSGQSIALQGDGKIVVGGNGSGPAYLVTRYNSDGSLDTAWDGDGIKSIAYDPAGGNTGFADAGVRSVAVQPDGRILALGHKNIIYRFNADGSADTSFDGDGARQALIGTDKDTYSLAVSAGGRITVVGTLVPPACSFMFPCGTLNLRFFTARYNPDGTPDPTFGTNGNLEINPGAAAGAMAVKLDSQGRTVVAGIASFSSTSTIPWGMPQLSAARISAPPSVGPVGVSGRVTRPDGTPVSNAILILQGGSTSMTALTNPFGYYSFQGVPSGQAYAVSPGSKKALFDDRNLFVDNEIANFNIVGQEP